MNGSYSTRTRKPSSPKKMKAKKVESSAYRNCDHWGCSMNECIFKTTSETPAIQGPLHQKPPVKSSLPPPSPDAKKRAGKGSVSSSRLSNASTSTGARSFASSSCKGRSSDGSFALRDLVGEDVADHSIGERSSSSILSGCSSEFKMTVSNVSMIDNTNEPGTYTGTIDRRNNKPHGQGTMVYADSIYEGQWVNGDWNGFGSLTEMSTGNYYQGGFFDNMKHGLGVMKYCDGRVYDGVFMLDKLESKGKLTSTDGTKYWGQWSRNGAPHGRGKMEYTDGRVFDGEFNQGVRSGHGRMTFPDGSWYLGEWCNGEPNGLGIKVTANGDLVHEGIFSKGKPIDSSSMPHQNKSSGRFLLYRSSVTTYGGGTLVGPLPRQVHMRPAMSWATKNL